MKYIKRSNMGLRTRLIKHQHQDSKLLADWRYIGRSITRFFVLRAPILGWPNDLREMRSGKRAFGGKDVLPKTCMYVRY